MGDLATLTLTVSNPGDGAADHVKVQAILPEGLEHTRGKQVEMDLGNLVPNESRTVQLVCATRAGGIQACQFVAVAEGNLSAQDKVQVDIILPRIEIAATGPKLRYLDRPAVYPFQVT